MSSPERHRRAMDLFQRALDLGPERRASWVAEQTEDDADLRSDVESLIRAHEMTGGILDQPPPGEGASGAGSLPFSIEEIEATLRESLADSYRVVEEIGRGGMAFVFLAWERKHDRRVVLKVLRPELALLYGSERFEREVKLAAQLSHPHIVGLIDSGTAEGLFYYVMPYVEGETLKERLLRRGPLPVEEAMTLLRDVASALAHAHGLGIVHRDLKPANVLCAGSHAYLMDFGVAKTLAPGDDTVTQPGLVVGTPQYMAPEQARSDPTVDHRLDLYAWGLLAYEMLLGDPYQTDPSRPPTEGVTEPVARYVRSLRPEIPPGIATLVGRCVEPESEVRPESAEGIVTELDAHPVVTHSSSRTTRVLVWAAATVVVAAAATFFGSLGDRAGTELGLPGPVAVAPFTNETDEPALDPLGRLAGDWIAQGLQQAGLVPVLPWPTALESAERAVAASTRGAHPDLVSFLAEDVDAGTVITGSFYEIGSEIRFGATVTNARDGTVLSAPEPVTAHRDSAEAAIRELRDRLMGSLAVFSSERISDVPGLTHRPPTFEAYRVFDRGMELYLNQDYGQAAAEFQRAFELDTTFTVSLLSRATNLYNQGRYAAVDSVLTFLEPRRDRLSEYHDLRFRYMRAVLDGDEQRALRLAHQASELGPNTRASYNSALMAVHLNRPLEALRILEAIDPDRGSMRGWAQYWTQLTHALHLIGEHEREIDAAEEMRARYPERRVATVLHARALAAAARVDDLERLLDEIATLPPRTYWSHGGALVVAGEELAAHGGLRLGTPYLERAVAWLEGQLAADSTDRSHRYWLGSALYDLGLWTEAGDTFESLAHEYPDRTDYRGMSALSVAQQGDRQAAENRLGPEPAYNREEYIAYRGRVEAALGDPNRALDLFSEALGRGVDGWPWLHASARSDLWRLAGDPRFDRLVAGTEEVPSRSP